MHGAGPGIVWWLAGVGLGVTALYYAAANTVDVLMRRWARRLGCPVCGAVRRGGAPGPGAGAPAAPAGADGER